jgi:hypothetical protein
MPGDDDAGWWYVPGVASFSSAREIAAIIDDSSRDFDFGRDGRQMSAPDRESEYFVQAPPRRPPLTVVEGGRAARRDTAPAATRGAVVFDRMPGDPIEDVINFVAPMRTSSEGRVRSASPGPSGMPRDQDGPVARDPHPVDEPLSVPHVGLQEEEAGTRPEGPGRLSMPADAAEPAGPGDTPSPSPDALMRTEDCSVPADTGRLVHDRRDGAGHGREPAFDFPPADPEPYADAHPVLPVFPSSAVDEEADAATPTGDGGLSRLARRSARELPGDDSDGDVGTVVERRLSRSDARKSRRQGLSGAPSTEHAPLVRRSREPMVVGLLRSGAIAAALLASVAVGATGAYSIMRSEVEAVRVREASALRMVEELRSLRAELNLSVAGISERLDGARRDIEAVRRDSLASAGAVIDAVAAKENSQATTVRAIAAVSDQIDAMSSRIADSFRQMEVVLDLDRAMRSQPAASQAPSSPSIRRSPPPPAPSRPAVQAAWQVIGGAGSHALVTNPGTGSILRITGGSVLDGLGTVRSVEVSGGRYVVVFEDGRRLEQAGAR